MYRCMHVHILANKDNLGHHSLGAIFFCFFCFALLHLRQGLSLSWSPPSDRLDSPARKSQDLCLPANSQLGGLKCTPPCPALFNVGSGNGTQAFIVQGKHFYWVSDITAPTTYAFDLSKVSEFLCSWKRFALPQFIWLDFKNYYMKTLVSEHCKLNPV